MDLQDLIELFRKQVADKDDPYLWDDEEVLQYIIEAQDTFVQRTGGISVMTVVEADDPDNEELHDLEISEDGPYSDFSPYILRIRSARLVTARRDVKIISEADFSQIRTVDYGIISPTFLDDTDTGTVTHGIIGLVDKKLRWYKVPSEDDTCRLHVYRLPYPRIASQEDDLEIPEQYHIHLLKGAKASAYMKEDAETYDKELASSNEQMFEKVCEEARLALDRQRFKPRTIQYGGI